MTTTNSIFLETGELREGSRASSRIFFVYVTPTGAEIPITKCPHLLKIYSRTDGGFEGSSRQTTTEYEVKFSCTLKMVNLYSIFGRPNTAANIFIDVDPDMAVIELSGVEGFGKFKGRGKINIKRSTLFIGRGPYILNEDTLKNSFGYRILQPPRKGERGSSARSLIF